MHRREGEMEERDWWVAGVINKRTYKSYLGGLMMSRPLNLPSRILKCIKRP